MNDNTMNTGEMPSNWKIHKIADCTKYVDYRGKTPIKTASGRVLVTARNIKQGYIDYRTSQEYISENDYEEVMRRGKPRLGDVLITTEAPLGNIATIDDESIALAQRVIKFRADPNLLINNYLKYYFLSARFQRILDEHSSGTTAKGIKGSVLHQLPVIIPPLPEQTAIAEALTDADALITSLENLIGKKRAIKQGAMQELLTGKRRLPGFEKICGLRRTEIGDFPNDWEIMKIKQVCKLINGRGFKPYEWKESGYPIIRIQNLNGSEEFNYYQGAFNRKILIETGQLLFAWSGSRGTSFGPHIWNGVTALLNYHTWKIEVNDALIKQNYFYYALVYLTKQIEDEAHGASALVHTQKGEMENFFVSLPSIQEQIAIAAVLSDTDAEIQTLEQKLEKYRQIKQGMMQELLTGRIRLI